MTPKPRSAIVGRVVVVVAVVAFIGLGAIALVKLPAALLENWIPGSNAEEKGKLLGQAAQIVLFGLGGMIAVVSVTLSILRHRVELDAADRDRQQRRADAEREMRARFVTAVDLLSAPEPIKRTAALYSLAALADDWEIYGRTDEVQVCIDVICGYLRAPLPDRVMLTPVAEKEVKTTGFALIRERLRLGSARSWSQRIVNLSRAHIDLTVDLSGANIAVGGMLDLSGVTIAHGGKVELSAATVSHGGNVELSAATVAEGGRVELSDVTVSYAAMSLLDVTVSHGAIVSLSNVRAEDGGRVNVSGAMVAKGGTVDVWSVAVAHGGRVNLTDPIVEDGGRVTLHDVSVAEGGIVDLFNVNLADGGVVNLHDLYVADSGINFSEAEDER